MKNPILPGQFADPSIIQYNDRYYLYPTTDGCPGWSGTVFHAFSSDDLLDWRDEGVAFYSATKKDTNTITIYRVYNSKLKRGQHHYTKSATERDSLVKNSGWKSEGVGFYGYSSANPKAAQPVNND